MGKPVAGFPCHEHVQLELLMVVPAEARGSWRGVPQPAVHLAWAGQLEQKGRHVGTAEWLPEYCRILPKPPLGRRPQTRRTRGRLDPSRAPAPWGSRLAE